MVDAGIMDSYGIIELITFIEKEFAITVPNDAITPERFGSIDLMAEYVLERQGGTTNGMMSPAASPTVPLTASPAPDVTPTPTPEVAGDYCTKCVLPSSFPRLSIDAEGVCNLCRTHEDEETRRQESHSVQREEFRATVESVRGMGSYDALCCFSGGKDSTYMLRMMVKDFGLRVLAFTLDNGFLAPIAKSNIESITGKLGVDHLYFRPSPTFMAQMYRESMFGDLNEHQNGYETRISDACLSCISLVNAQAARLALQMKIPMIFAGFTPGQIPRPVIKNGYRFYRDSYAGKRKHFESILGPEATNHFQVPESEQDVYLMSPYLVHHVSEAEILQVIRDMGWDAPEKLDGCTSNCELNAVANLIHEKRYGFHPYASELSTLVRKGLLTRDEAMEKLSTAMGSDSMDDVLSRLGTSSADRERINAHATED